MSDRGKSGGSRLSSEDGGEREEGVDRAVGQARME